jgi:hypothetical protein
MLLRKRKSRSKDSHCADSEHERAFHNALLRQENLTSILRTQTAEGIDFSQSSASEPTARSGKLILFVRTGSLPAAQNHAPPCSPLDNRA